MMRHALKAALLISSALVAAPAIVQAQTPLQAPPPESYTLDPRGVDLTSGKFIRQAELVSIGDPAGAGLSYARTFFNGAWRDNVTGTLTSSGAGGAVYSLSIGGSTDVFTKSGTTFTPTRNVGQTLTQSGNTFTYTLPDGTVATFDRSLSDRSLPTPQTLANRGRISKLVRPNGETLTFSYEVAEEWGEVQGTPPDQLFWAIRLRAVNSNYGYQLFFNYQSEGQPDYLSVDTWRRMTKVTAYNSAHCSWGGFAEPVCSGGAAVWPSATFSGSTTTDQGGRATYYGWAGANYTFALRLPENPSVDAVKYVYDTNQRVTSAQVAGQAWTYAYSDTSGVRTVTVTAPDGGVTVAKSSLSTGLLTSYKDPLNQTTSYAYDTNGRVTKITLPATNSVNYTYNARGNVTQTTVAPPSLLSNPPPSIVSSATYPASCTNRVTCNLPITATDPRGAVTNYSYDPTHGGVTAVTLPAPATGGVRPETRITYEARQAWISDGAGGFVAQAPITLPVSTSTCVSGSSCVGTVNEVKTTIVYGANSVANNLHPTSVSQGSGDGLLTTTTRMIYTPTGDVASVDGPLAGTADTTTYRYDAARQPVGVIGPDPDGSGGLLRRARRATYNADGAVTLVEAGTVTGLTDANWSSFASLQRVASTYDAYGRVTQRRSQSGSTTNSLVQTSYDASGRQDCVTTRMNPATFASPPASACTLATAGAFGPDRATKYGYDAAGRLTSTISGFGSGATITESATYTANGKPLTLTDGNGNVSTMVYDAFDRLSRLRYPNASGGGSSTTDYEEYGYDAGSNVTSFLNRAGELIGANYDALNRQTALGGSVVADRTFAYDLMNRPTAVTYSTSGVGSTKTWDALSRMTSEMQTGVGAIGYGYDLAGRRTTMSWPDGFFANYDYNVAGDLTAIRENGAAWQLAWYGYDNLGRLTAQGRANGATTTWGYDGASRLTSLSHDLAGTANDQTLGFIYNPAGQIATRSMSNPAYAYMPGTGATAYVNNGRNQVTSVGGSAISYDGRQNITTAPSGTYGYNANNELTSATVAGTTTALSYDPAGRLYQVGTTRFAYDGQQVIGEYNTSGGLLRRYVPGLGLDDVVTAYEGSGYDRRWLLRDERRSVVSITDGSANAIATNTYDEYGVPGASNSGLFQYTGQLWLPQAQLYHYRARAYAPQLGRFMQVDPIGYAAGANVYAYVGADPVNLTDPFGLCPDSRDPECATEVAPIDVTASLCRFDATCIRGSDAIRDFMDRFTQLPEIVVVGFREVIRTNRDYQVQCAAGQSSGAVADAAGAGSKAQGLLLDIVETQGREAARAFMPLDRALASAETASIFVQGIQRGQSADVVAANAIFPILGSAGGARLGFGAGTALGSPSGPGAVIPAIALTAGGAYAGDQIGGMVADGYAALRGQYCK